MKELELKLGNFCVKNIFTSYLVVKECIVSTLTALSESIPEEHRNVLINDSNIRPCSNDTIVRHVDLIEGLIEKKT